MHVVCVRIILKLNRMYACVNVLRMRIETVESVYS